MTKITRIELAAEMAKVAHEGQFRKGSNKTPYFEHPEGVAIIIASFLPGNEDAVIMGYLHDVIEESEFTLLDINELFGETVSIGVSYLTKFEGETNQEYRENLALATPDVASVKCVDIVHNAANVVQYVGKKFAARWLPEKFEDMKYLRHADPAIYAMTQQVLNSAMDALAAA